jgi:CO/xanthine dehydrogenase Mo-binding subunit
MVNPDIVKAQIEGGANALFAAAGKRIRRLPRQKALQGSST